MERAVGMAEAKSKLSELVGQAKYGGETFILQRRGQPMAVLIGVDEFERLQMAAQPNDVDVQSPLPPALLRRQQGLVARAKELRLQLGAPEERLAELFEDLPDQEDEFWVEILETG